MSWKHNRFTPFWLGWGLMFLVIELTAVKMRDKMPGGTLSSLVWRFSDRRHKYRRSVFIVSWSVLSVHFLYGWFNIPERPKKSVLLRP